MSAQDITMFKVEDMSLQQIKFDVLLRPDVIFFSIKYISLSFSRYMLSLQDLARVCPHRELLFDFLNILSNIELALSTQGFYYSDFLTQFRCRVLKE